MPRKTASGQAIVDEVDVVAVHLPPSPQAVVEFGIDVALYPIVGEIAVAQFLMRLHAFLGRTLQRLFLLPVHGVVISCLIVGVRGRRDNDE